MNRRLAVALLAAFGLAVAIGAWCADALTHASGDPLRAPEVGGALAVATWAVLGLRIVVRDERLRRALDSHASTMEVAGVRFLLVDGGGRHAFVLGWLRPNVYIGAGLLADLQADELLAVLRHEEHHRKTRAPMHAAALEAWATLLRPFRPVRDAAARRLSDLEIEADRAAIDAGSSRATVARALLKTDWLDTGGTSFAADPVRRIEWLVGAASAGRSDRRRALPFEWLPIAAYVALLAACHIGVGPLA